MSDLKVDFLEEILNSKQAELKAARATRPIAELRAQCADMPPSRGFLTALRQEVAAGRLGVIAETKRKSPSAGNIALDADPAQQARIYSQAHATCMSVLTNVQYFGGAPADLQAARAAGHLPLLRKDFIIDAWQVYETRILGADCLLLITAALAESQLVDLAGLGMELGLDVLVEVAAVAEVPAALSTGSELLGVNNRDLKTMTTDLGTTERIAPMLTSTANLVVSESAIKDAADARRAYAAGAGAVLVGEALIRSHDPCNLVRNLRTAPGTTDATN